jgi:hypothetical protein
MWVKGLKYPEVLTSSSFTSGWTKAQTGNWQGWTLPQGNGYEGPSLVRFDGRWFLYCDDGRLKVSVGTNDFAQGQYGDFQPITVTPASVPRMNHGTPIRLH